ncbi:MAG TPA: hypothetical protein VFZ65_03660 [Planctomycetota bacterium]|nr:hypothetical protein [Planctomycetota bacterium]
MVLCLVAAALAFAVWLALPSGDTVPSDVAPTVPASSRRDAAEPVDATASRPDDSARSAVETAPTPPPATPPAGGTIALHGTFVVVDEDGVEHAHEDGEFTLVLWHGDTGSHRRAVTKAGAWQADVDELPDRVSVDDAHLGGRLVRCDDDLPIAEPKTAIVLRGRWLPLLLLRVLGDDTGADLADVHVVTKNDWRTPYPHPGSRAEVVVERATSPLRFAPTSTADTQSIWARAPGYAWDTIQLDTASRAERVMRLVPGGDVDVTIVGTPPDETWLRVREYQEMTRPPDITDEAWQTMQRASRGIPQAEVAPNRSGATRIDGLRTGTWAIDLEKGDWFRNPISLGSTTVEIAAGTIAAATITLRGDTRPPALAHTAGTLVVPAAWGEDVTLSIEARGPTKAWFDETRRIDADEMEHRANGEYAWDARLLPVGDYQVLVDGTEYRTRFALPPQGDEHVRIVVPDPCDVRVRVLDAETGRAIAGDWTPGWFSTPPDWEGGWTHAKSTAAPDGTFQFRAPPGPISINAHPDGYLWSHETYEVHPGANEFVLQIRRASGIDVVLKDADTTLPWPDFLSVELEDESGNSVVAYWSGNRVAAKQLGEFTLKVGTVQGYEPIPPRKVMVVAQEWTKVEIALRRKQ